MPNIHADPIETVISIVSGNKVSMSDDECLARLTRAVEDHDSEHLEEIARMIGRLAVTIE